MNFPGRMWVGNIVVRTCALLLTVDVSWCVYLSVELLVWIGVVIRECLYGI